MYLPLSSPFAILMAQMRMAKSSKLAQAILPRSVGNDPRELCSRRMRVIPRALYVLQTIRGEFTLIRPTFQIKARWEDITNFEKVEYPQNMGDNDLVVSFLFSPVELNVLVSINRLSSNNRRNFLLIHSPLLQWSSRERLSSSPERVPAWDVPMR